MIKTHHSIKKLSRSEEWRVKGGGGKATPCMSVLSSLPLSYSLLAYVWKYTMSVCLIAPLFINFCRLYAPWFRSLSLHLWAEQSKWKWRGISLLLALRHIKFYAFFLNSFKKSYCPHRKWLFSKIPMLLLFYISLFWAVCVIVRFSRKWQQAFVSARIAFCTDVVYEHRMNFF